MELVISGQNTVVHFDLSKLEPMSDETLSRLFNMGSSYPKFQYPYRYGLLKFDPIRSFGFDVTATLKRTETKAYIFDIITQSGVCCITYAALIGNQWSVHPSLQLACYAVSDYANANKLLGFIGNPMELQKGLPK